MGADGNTCVTFGRSLRASAPALLVASLVLALFIDKAFTIDDLTFLTIAEHMAKVPLHPAAVEMVFGGRPAELLSSGVWSGPVMPALLMPSVACGGAEWLAHLVMLLVFAAGIVATSALALRLGSSDADARWAALLTTTSAAVLAMATTSMPDVPAMAFAVLAAERAVAFSTHGGAMRCAVASVALALAVLSRPHAVLVAPCLLFLLRPTWPASPRHALCGREVRRCCVAILGALGLVALVYAVMHDSRAVDGLTSTPLAVSDRHWLKLNLANVPAQWVLCFPLGVCRAWQRGSSMIRSPWCWVAAALGAVLAWWTHELYHHPRWLLWQAPITALGTAVLVDAVVDSVHRRDPIDLGLSAWLLIAVPTATYLHLPPKYLVPSAPAMAILLVRSAARESVRAPTPLLVGAVLGLALGLLIIRADSQLADIGRRGGEVAGSYVTRGSRVWSDGSWGFQWYATKAGARPMSYEDSPAPGDIVVVGLNGWLARKLPHKTLLEEIRFDEPGGRIVFKSAGFYSNNGWGPLPWLWSRRPLSSIQVWQITN